MKHPYKSQLLFNLSTIYDNQNWRTITYFESSRDEILFVLPEDEDIKFIFGDLLNVLISLPEIDHPNERVVISFCYTNGSSYCSKIINPNTQDEINLALIGYSPKREIRITELQTP
jgi:hypothetical protein